LVFVMFGSKVAVSVNKMVNGHLAGVTECFC